MAPGYSTNGIIGFDPYSYTYPQQYNWPYQYTTPQIQVPYAPGYAPQKTTPTQTSQLPKANYSESSDSTATALTVGALALAVTAGACVVKKKNPVELVKSMFSKGTEAAKGNTTVKEGLKNLQVRFNSKGNVVYNIPGKTQKITNRTQIEEFFTNNPEFRALKELHTDGTSTIDACKFTLKHSGFNYNIELAKDGKIIIRDAANKDKNITSQYIRGGEWIDNLSGKKLEYQSELQSLIERIKACDSEVIFKKGYGLNNITFTNTMGDNILVSTQANFNKGTKPVVSELTKLKDFSRADGEITKYFRDERLAGNNIEALLANDFVTKGKLPTNYRVGQFDLKKGALKPEQQAIFNSTSVDSVRIVDNKPVGLFKGNKYYDENSVEFAQFMEANYKSGKGIFSVEKRREEHLQGLIETILKGGNIPAGATIVPI